MRLADSHQLRGSRLHYCHGHGHGHALRPAPRRVCHRHAHRHTNVSGGHPMRLPNADELRAGRLCHRHAYRHTHLPAGCCLRHRDAYATYPHPHGDQYRN